jgi:short-subunit dehydrogenase
VPESVPVPEPVTDGGTVLVTGATDGLGLLLARAYSAQGCRVLATGKRSLADGRALLEPAGITYVTAHQDDPQMAARAIGSALRELQWQQLDLAILNAAMGWSGEPSIEPLAVIARQIDVNFKAQVHIASVLAPFLFAGGGKLVMVGSAAVGKAHGGFATYVATKTAVDGFCRSLHEEWRGRAEVLIVHPGPTRTTMHAKAGLDTGRMARWFMAPQSVAKAIQVAIRRGDRKRRITRLFCWRAGLSPTCSGRL